MVNFPKGEKYVSLLRNAEDPEAQKVLEAERRRIRAKVQQHMADIAMITQADEGNPQLHQQKATPASPALQQVSMHPPYLRRQPELDCASCLGQKFLCMRNGAGAPSLRLSVDVFASQLLTILKSLDESICYQELLSS